MLKRLIIFVVALALLTLLAAIFIFWRYPIATYAFFHRRDLVQGGLTKATVETPVGRQTLFQGGSGAIPIVFLHGAGDQAGAWSNVAPRLAGRFRVLVLDLPGHGESAPAEGPLKMETMLAGTEAVLAANPQPAILVGNSLGAWIAMVYAIQHPERVARVIAVDGGPLRGDRPDLSVAPANREQARKVWDAILDPSYPRIPDFFLDDVVRQSQHGPIGRMQPGEMAQYLFDGRLNQLTVPVDLLWGESDRLVPVEYAKRMEAQLPAARLTLLPRCGHIPQQECPLAFGAALDKILQQPPPTPHQLTTGTRN